MLPRFPARFRHKKRIVIVSLISLTSIVVTVLMYQVLLLDESESEYRSWPKPSETRVKSKVTSACPDLSIHDQQDSVSVGPATCQLPRVRENACLFAKSIFTINSNPDACNDSLVNLCKVLRDQSAGPHSKVECHTPCGSSDLISVGFINPDDGSLRWQRYSFLQDVEKELNNYIQHTPTHQYFPFAFLRCDEFLNPTANTQLFVLPPRSVTGDKTQRRSKARPININIILIDSVSIPHFYRSLPQTVKMFKNINAKSSTIVLDFELFHTIKARTFETINALFSGELQDVEQFVNPFPVKAAVMFSKFKSLGYQTMWQEDMCWMYEWGLVRDFSVMNKRRPLIEIWHNLTAVLKNNSIDFTGITHSSCEVLKSFGVPDPFHGPHKLCYGGMHYHSHLLQFLNNFIDEVNSNSGKKSLFSFTMLDIGHEDSGLRIQTLDSSLANFVNKLASDQNTLSVILSDHGNTYGSFPLTVDGRFEAYQPHLFMVIPDHIQSLFGNDKMQGLIYNQKRLVSIIDLHHALMTVAASFVDETPSTEDPGLFELVSRNRSCDDLGMPTHSLCVCQGWERKVAKGSFHFIVAEFALGQLNEKIQSSFLGSSESKRPVSGFGSCERLKGERFENVRERRVAETLTVSLDIFVQHGEAFSVEVQVITGSVLFDMKLTHFSRLSEYGIYQTCADRGVDLRLCVCGKLLDGKSYLSTDQGKPHLSTISIQGSPKWQHYGESFHSETKADNMHNNCLFILLREHQGGVVFEVANSCSFVFYSVELHLSLSNMQISENTPVRKDLPPGTIHFLVAVVQLDPTVDWKWKYTLNFSWKLLSQYTHLTINDRHQ